MDQPTPISAEVYKIHFLEKGEREGECFGDEKQAYNNQIIYIVKWITEITIKRKTDQPNLGNPFTTNHSSCPDTTFMVHSSSSKYKVLKYPTQNQ